MKFKRIVTSITANFDQFIASVENHEAVADATIKEVKQGAAKIQTQLRITQQRLTEQQSLEAKFIDDCEMWKRRAVTISETSSEKALSCVQALQFCEEKLSHLQEQIRENEQLAVELDDHLKEVEQRLDTLTIKRNSLSARSAKNKALAFADTQDIGLCPENVFSRWEESISSNEYTNSREPRNPHSHLDNVFRKKESKEKLQEKLNSLLANKPRETPSEVSDNE